MATQSVPSRLGNPHQITIHGKPADRSVVRHIPLALPDTSKPEFKQMVKKQDPSFTEVSIDLDHMSAPSLVESSNSGSECSVNNFSPTSANLSKVRRMPIVQSISRNNTSRPSKLGITAPPISDVKLSVPRLRNQSSVSKMGKLNATAPPPAETVVPDLNNKEVHPVGMGFGAYGPQTVMDKGAPKFDKMTPDQREAYKDTLRQHIKDIINDYPELQVEMPSITQTVEVHYSVYFNAMKRIIIGGGMGLYEMCLSIVWLAVEYMGTNFLGVDMTGYHDMMMGQMIRYRMLLYRWKEKNFTLAPSAASEEEPLAAIFKSSMMTAVLIWGCNRFGNSFAGKAGADFAKGFLPMITDNLVHPSMPTPPNAKEIREKKEQFDNAKDMVNNGAKMFKGSSDNAGIPPPENKASPYDF